MHYKSNLYQIFILRKQKLIKKNFLLINFLLFFFFLFVIDVSKNNGLASRSPNQFDQNYLKFKPYDDYILDSGDVISIKISPALPELDEKVLIETDGTVFLKKIERIYIRGLTKTELINLLNEKYKNIIKGDISIDISILKFRPIRVFVDGEVIKGGLYRLNGVANNNPLKESEKETFENQMYEEQIYQEQTNKNIEGIKLISEFPTLYDVLKKAGGITENADISKISVIRNNSLNNGGGYKKTTINFLDIFVGYNSNSNIRIYDQDTVIVPKSIIPQDLQLSKAIKHKLNPKFIKITVSGKVNQPGVYQINKSASLNDALSLAGDIKAVRGKVKFTRFNDDGTTDRRIFSYKRLSEEGSYKNPYLKNGDLITVGNSFIDRGATILKDFIASPLQIYTNIKILESLE